MLITGTNEYPRGTVFAHIELEGNMQAVAHDNDSVWHGRAEDFRPIRTPEQVAAEAREAAIESALSLMPGEVRCKSVVEKAVGIMIDAGYSK